MSRLRRRASAQGRPALLGMVRRDDVPVRSIVSPRRLARSCGLRLYSSFIERGQLILPRKTLIYLGSSRGLRFEQGVGHIKFAAGAPTTHDDVADALGLATLPYNRRGSGEISCKLGSLSSPRAVPDAECMGNGPTVQTGSGIRLVGATAVSECRKHRGLLPSGRTGRHRANPNRPNSTTAPDKEHPCHFPRIRS